MNQKCKIESCNKSTGHEYLYDYCQEHIDKIIKDEYREELRYLKKNQELPNLKLYVVGIDKGSGNWDRGIWRKFSIYYLKDKRLTRIWLSNADCPHWVKPKENLKGGYFEDRVLGMDRIFDIVYSLGMWLFNDGYYFDSEFLSSL